VNAACVIDGFNVYHSIRDLQTRCGRNYRWLDLRALCASQMHLISPEASTCGVFYFSALATHFKHAHPEKPARHRVYVTALESRGVQAHMGRFKRKDVTFTTPACRVWLRRHEEKETDVAMAVKLVELAASTACQAVILISEDTDLAPALRAARAIAPDKPLYVLFPHGRANRELARLCTASFKLSERAYAGNQLPDVISLGSGREVRRPAGWV
jgi:uncharacterized LabA/DUF88 family protein